MKWLWSKLYALAVRVHNPGVSKVASPIPVINVGNLEVGGTGKSPIAQAICVAMAERGKRPAIFARGYGGNLKGPVKVNPSIHDYTQVGDEPLMHALAGFDTYICGDRAKAIELAVLDGVDIAVLDDGHATKSVQKDFSILVFRPGFAQRPELLPLGRLREPLDKGLARANFAIVNGLATDDDKKLFDSASVYFLEGSFAVEPPKSEQPMTLVTGVANPNRVYDSAQKAGWNIQAHLEFPDHHQFTDADWAKAQASGLRLLLTAKDAVKAPAGLDFVVLNGGWRPEDEAEFQDLIGQALSARRDQ